MIEKTDVCGFRDEAFPPGPAHLVALNRDLHPGRIDVHGMIDTEMLSDAPNDRCGTRLELVIGEPERFDPVAREEQLPPRIAFRDAHHVARDRAAIVHWGAAQRLVREI